MSRQELSSILQKNLFRWFFLPSLALLVVFAAFTTWRLAEKEQQRNILLVDSLSKYIETYVDNALSSLQQAADMVISMPLLHTPGALRNIQESHLQFERLIWVDQDQKVLAAAPKGIIGSLYPLTVLQEMGGIISTPAISPETGKLVAQMGSPVTGGGLIVGELGLTELQEYVNDFLPPGEGHVILMDTFGNLIAYPDMALVSQQTNIGHQEVYAKAIKDPEQTFLYTQNGRSYLGSAARIPNTNWLLIVARPMHTLVTAVSSSLIAIATIVLGLFMLVLWLLRRDLARRVTGPLTEFTSTLARVSQGDYSATFDSSGTFAELAMLREAYDRMGRTIAEREHDLRLSERKYRNIFNNSLEGIFQTQPDGRFAVANPALAKILGYDSPQQLMEQVEHVSQLYARPEDREPFVSRIRQKKVVVVEQPLLRADGEQIWCHVSARGVFEDGNLQIIEGAAIDITLRKQAEQERNNIIAELEEKNEELERFIYMVSHDLKSPLITIKGFVGMLRKDLENNTPEEAESSITRIDTAATRMHTLLEELLEFSRIGRLDNITESVHLSEVVTEALEMVEGHVRRHGTRVDVAPDLPTIRGDRPRLLEVFQNLLENAIKFSAAAEQPQVSVGLEQHAGLPTIVVRDNGIGIPEKYRERIFGIFEQLDPSLGGSGIGLAMVRRIVENHCGEIWICTAPEQQGTSVCMTLPGKKD